MVNIKNTNQIILDLIDYFKLAQPNLDTKPGTVARDLFIEAPANQLSLLYGELSTVSNLQSIQLAAANDLDKLAKNFGITRNKPSSSTGTALVTFNSLSAPISINRGDIIYAENGIGFTVTTGVSLSPANANTFKSIATKFKNDLDYVGITDQYAVQVLVQCISPGLIGNIPKYFLSRTNVVGASNVTNVASFTGGTDQESDTAFRARVISIFNGASVGTSLGYRNTALSTTNVIDALVIGPGDPLMVRDGTVSQKNSDGSYTILSEGQGGKVDLVVLGENQTQNLDSFIYRDKSNVNDPTNPANDYVLGQIADDANKTINRRRIDDIANATLPAQPADSITQVVGSASGSNFKPKTVDSLGRISGNYELVKDTGTYAGSPWGFDKLKWISNQISLYQEDIIKGKFNGQDATSYTDVLQVPRIYQDISIKNENSTVTSDRSIIKLYHTPARSVSRVFNVNTGEQYLITDQNVGSTSSINTSGLIKISGNTLPAPTDVLQVDYSWIFDYDPYSDFDGKYNTSNYRPSTDSIDWGYCSQIGPENVTATKSQDGHLFTCYTSHQISSVIKANVYSEVDGVVTKINQGTNVNRLQIVFTKLQKSASSIENIYLKNTYYDVFNTSQKDGSFSSIAAIGIINNTYTTTVLLPTDTSAKEGDKVTMIYNSSDVYNVNEMNGSFTSNVVTIPSQNIIEAGVSEFATQTKINIFYIADVQNLFTTGLTSLPISRVANSYVSSNTGFINNYTQNNISRENYTALYDPNIDGYYITMTIGTPGYDLNSEGIVSIIRISDSAILWDQSKVGSVTIDTNGSYQINFNANANVQPNDKVIVLYYANKLLNTQPFSWINYPMYKSIDSVKSIDEKKYINLINFIDVSSLKIKLINPTTNEEIFSATDGELVGQGITAKIISASSNFLGDGYEHYKLQIEDESNYSNNATFDIISIDSSTQITIGLSLDNIANNQISAIRILDNKEVWDSNGSIDISNNRLYLSNNNLNVGDYVFSIMYTIGSLRTSPTKLSATISDQINNAGTVTFQGTTLLKLSDVVFNVTNSGLVLDLSEAIASALGYNSVSSLNSNIKLARVVKLEKVTVAGANSTDVISTINTYDLNNYYIKDNELYSNECFADATLNNYSFRLSSVKKNTLNTSQYPYLPSQNDKMRVTCYVSISNDSDSLVYVGNGTLYTNKTFALINRILIASGFSNANSATLTINSMNQPNIGVRYRSFYDYTAPKINERISITYNYNKLIGDVTFNVENNRPINADVLVKQANAVNVSVTMGIIVSPAYINSSSIILQNVKDRIISAINISSLGATLDSSDLVNSAYGIQGVDRARIIYFNTTGSYGQVLSLIAQKNEYLTADNVIIQLETR